MCGNLIVSKGSLYVYLFELNLRNLLYVISILRHFIMGNDFSHFGLVNAVTRSSQDVADYNRATELERIGGTLLDEGVDRAAKKGLLLLPAAA